MTEENTLKHCGHGCGYVKPREAFGNDKSRPDGKDIYCKECRARMRRRRKRKLESKRAV